MPAVEVRNPVGLPTSDFRLPTRRIDTPWLACLDSRSRLGTSNPPLAGIAAAHLALGGLEQAVWRRSVRNPVSASGMKPGNGFGQGHNQETGERLALARRPLSCVRVGSRESKVERRT